MISPPAIHTIVLAALLGLLGTISHTTLATHKANDPNTTQHQADSSDHLITKAKHILKSIYIPLAKASVGGGLCYIAFSIHKSDALHTALGASGTLFALSTISTAHNPTSLTHWSRTFSLYEMCVHLNKVTSYSKNPKDRERTAIFITSQALLALWAHTAITDKKPPNGLALLALVTLVSYIYLAIKGLRKTYAAPTSSQTTK